MSSVSVFAPGHGTVIPRNENYRGLSYGAIIARWTNWLMGSKPDYYDGSDILFLRGNVGYYNNRFSFYDRGDARRFNKEKFPSTPGNGVMIHEDTAVFIPIITAQFNIGDYYSGARIEDENSIRRAIREDLDGGGEMWATICDINNAKKTYSLVDDLKEYRVESPLFKMLLTEQNPFRKIMEVPKEPGIYDAATGGYFVLLTDLTKDKKTPKEYPYHYAIRFGGKGRGNYYTDAVYEITVNAPRATSVEDVSSKGHGPQDAYDRVNFTFLDPTRKTESVGITPTF
jgi:hypothetical protein